MKNYQKNKQYYNRDGYLVTDSAAMKIDVGFEKIKGNKNSTVISEFKFSGPPYVDQNGYMWIDCRATRLGLMTYRNKDGGGFHQELKSEEELFSKSTIDSFLGLPVTIEHPYEGVVTPKSYELLAVGHTMTIPVVDEAHFLRARIQITKDGCIEDIRDRIANGVRYEVSCGYSADLDWTSGKWNGNYYDCIQRNIMFNHLALVGEGRAGKEVKLLYNVEKNKQPDE